MSYGNSAPLSTFVKYCPIWTLTRQFSPLYSLVMQCFFLSLCQCNGTSFIAAQYACSLLFFLTSYTTATCLYLYHMKDFALLLLNDMIYKMQTSSTIVCIDYHCYWNSIGSGCACSLNMCEFCENIICTYTCNESITLQRVCLLWLCLCVFYWLIQTSATCSYGGHLLD